MTTMAARWHPYTVLGLQGDEAPEGEIQCSAICYGQKRRGHRCRWTTDAEEWINGDDDRDNARRMLSALERKFPSEVTLDDLKELAAVCVCRRRHRHMGGDVAGKWLKQVQGLAAIPAEAPPRPSTPGQANPSQHPPNVYTCGNPTPPRSQENLKLSSSGTSSVDPPPKFDLPVFESSPSHQTDQELRDAKAKISDLSSRNEKLNARLGEQDFIECMTKEKLERVQKKLDKLSSEKDSLIEQSKKDLARQRELMEEKSRLVEQSKKDLAVQRQLTEENRALSQEMATLKRQLESAAAENDSLRGELDCMTAENSSLRGALNSVTAENKSLRGELGFAAAENESLQGQLDSAVADNNKLEGQNAGVAGELRETQDALRVSRQIVSHLERKLQDERAKLVLRALYTP
ncbi:hypothetical protein B0T14DRAFT_556270 [Immersiella caudata]|uniref:Uncharacterized protein n=1 Tax=Immersiella caudata TaxID=314043 RepID=A0AA39WK72_9PEZI|nr:hypothetical protein B0T14DRAFT_556270 [Immersiella caudata]